MTVSDAGLTEPRAGERDSDADATINAVNDPPTLDAIANPASVNEDSGEQTVNLSGISAAR